jgi:hypothetical protein
MADTLCLERAVRSTQLATQLFERCDGEHSYHRTKGIQKNTHATEQKEYKRRLMPLNKRNTKEDSCHRTKGIQKKTHATEQKEYKRTSGPYFEKALAEFGNICCKTRCTCLNRHCNAHLGETKFNAHFQITALLTEYFVLSS